MYDAKMPNPLKAPTRKFIIDFHKERCRMIKKEQERALTAKQRTKPKESQSLHFSRRQRIHELIQRTETKPAQQCGNT